MAKKSHGDGLTSASVRSKYDKPTGRNRHQRQQLDNTFTDSFDRAFAKMDRPPRGGYR